MGTSRLGFGRHRPARAAASSPTKVVLRTEIAALDTRLSTQIANLVTRLSTQIAEVRAEMRAEIANLETRPIRWMVGTVIATATLTVGIIRRCGAQVSAARVSWEDRSAGEG